jgi:hypothetical protein
MSEVDSKDNRISLSKDEFLIPEFRSELDDSNLPYIEQSAIGYDTEILGNSVLLIIATVGSTFFYLPHFAREIGLLSTTLMVLASAGLGYGCSVILLIGYKYTGAKTYNECMERMLGSKVGVFSSLVISLHTIGKVMSTWIFSFDFIADGLGKILKWAPDNWYNVNLKFIYFSLCLCILVVSISIKSIQRFQFVSFLGLLMMVYLLGVFLYLTPRYYSYYNSQHKINPTLVIFNWNMLKVWGVVNYMFLNQYAVTPMCATLKHFSYPRASRILSLSTIVTLAIYLALLFIGYFSLPTDSDNKIFLLRPSIPGDDDSLIVYGRLVFGITLLIVVVVRTQFMLIYIEQVCNTLSKIFNPRPIHEYPERTIYRRVSWFLKRFLFLLAHTVMTYFGVKHLSSILGFLGSFVGVFEIIILPCFLFLGLNAKLRVVSKRNERIFVAVCLAAALVSVSAVIASLV